MKNFRKISKGVTLGVIFLSAFFYLALSVLAVSADRDNFVILGKSAKDIEGKSVLMDEKIILRTAPDINSQEQGRLESGSSVLVLDMKKIELETFYLVMKVGQGGGLSGWVSEDYIYEITTEPQGE